MAAPKVSILTPTFKRERHLKRQLDNVLNQTYNDFEWLVLDDSDQPSNVFRGVGDTRIRYTHLKQRLSLGDKRNWLVRNAASEILMHFDDDDYYAPFYVERMAARLAAGCDAAKLSGFFVYAELWDRFGYWDQENAGGTHWQFDVSGVKQIFVDKGIAAKVLSAKRGYGFSYVYRKHVWRASPFQPVNFGEDGAFFDAAYVNGFKLDLFLDNEGLCLHVIQQDNASSCYPQYMLPIWTLEKIFGPNAIVRR
jgi:glycosyltransferase involved in cell wall biosynthesis